MSFGMVHITQDEYNDLVGHKEMLDKLEDMYPEVIEEMVGKILSEKYKDIE